MPATWGGEIPKAGEIVTIPFGSDVLLDEDTPDLGGLIILGSLTFAHKDLSLSSRWILVDGGTFAIGSPEVPYANYALITLTGAEEETSAVASVPRHMGTKFIGVMRGGRLELHGERAGSRNWTLLDGHAPAGSSSLRVIDDVDWRVGDRLVIAPSGFDPTEAEEVTVTSVSERVIHFVPSLNFDHWGELQSFGGHRIDERAEVACLTRTIVIQGDASSADSDFGGHLMSGPGSTVRVEGVEFYRMGQKGHAARYPIHWHLAKDRKGDYARGNSIHHSYHRAIVVHGTSNVLVEGNVSYDVWSHAFVPSEDGSETGNEFVDNLGILTRQLALGDYAFPVTAAGASLQSEGRPGAFWMKSPEQILRGNHAAGVINGMGFLFDGPGPGENWTGSFSNNTAHSCSAPPGTPASHYPSLTKGYGLFVEGHRLPAEIVFEGFAAYKNALSGVWLEEPGHRVRNATLADNGTGAILFQSSMEGSVVVGQSANRIGVPPSVGTSLAGGVLLMSGDDLKAPQLRQIDFFDQETAGIVMLGTRLHPLSTFENLKFFNTLPFWIERPAELTGGLTDRDGSLLGNGIPVYVHPDDDLVKTSETVFVSAINAWVTPLAQLKYLLIASTFRTADEIGFTLLVGDDGFGELPDTRLRDEDPTLSAYVRKDSSYTLLRADPLICGVRVSVEGGDQGFVLLEIPFAGPAYLYGEVPSGFGTPVPNFKEPTPQADNINEFGASSPAIWFEDHAAGNISLRLQDNQAVVLFDQPAGGLDVTIPEVLWQSQQFGYQLMQDPDAAGIWESLSDPDGDGYPNLMEFFLGSDPLQMNQALAVDPMRRCLSFSRSPEGFGLGFFVSYSHDLTRWSSAVLQESQRFDGRILVSATEPDPSSGPLFYVLNVHRVP